jgi:hypothetical protein
MENPQKNLTQRGTKPTYLSVLYLEVFASQKLHYEAIPPSMARRQTASHAETLKARRVAIDYIIARYFHAFSYLR